MANSFEMGLIDRSSVVCQLKLMTAEGWYKGLKKVDAIKTKKRKKGRIGYRDIYAEESKEKVRGK